MSVVQTENLNIAAFDHMPSPEEIKARVPMTVPANAAVVAGRKPGSVTITHRTWVGVRLFGKEIKKTLGTDSKTITVYPWDSISGSSIRCAQDRLYSWYVLRTQSQECAADLFIFIYR